MLLNLFLFYQVVRPLGHKSVNKYLYLYLNVVGLMRLKRRYRVLLQMNRLRKAIKDPQNGRYMDTMKSVCLL